MLFYNRDPRLDKLLAFAETYTDWLDRIQKEPYFIKVKREGNIALLKYNMYESDLGNDIVQACRGIIVDLNKVPRRMVLCQSFYKFFNRGECIRSLDGSIVKELDYKIDWTKPHEVQEKLDGSIMRLWYYNGKWNLSTSGTIDAKDAEIQGMNMSYADLFWSTLEKYYPNREVLDMLNKTICYSFELVSPEARIVVNYKDSKLYLLTAFDLKSYQEINIREYPDIKNLKFEVPRFYSDEAIEKLMNLDNFEGWVVTQVDDNGVIQRVKIKTETYKELFKLRCNDGSDKELLKSIIDGTIDDRVAAFPEYGKRAEILKQWLADRINMLNQTLDSCHYDLERKVFAANYAHLDCAWHCFMKYNNRNYKAEDFYLNLDNFSKVWDLFRQEIV